MVHGGLGGAPRLAVSSGGVLAVLDHVEVETAEIAGAEIVQFLVHLVELVAVIGLGQFALQRGCPVHGPAIQRQHLAEGQRIHRRIKPVQVGQQEAGGIANAAIGIRRAPEDFIADHQLAAIVGGRYPQAQDVGAQVVHHGIGCDHIADGL